MRASPRFASQVKKIMWRTVYEVVSLRESTSSVTVMNYGYAPVDVVAPDRWPMHERFGLQLYAQVAGARDISGKDVLEVGCGRGGGAAFVFEQFNPRSMTGLDLARTAINRSRAKHGRPGLEFITGDAEHLPFEDGGFDVVLSVESSHCYGNPLRLLREVHRVLRPNGLLLLADLRLTLLTTDNDGPVFHRDDVARLHQQVADAGFVVCEEQDITANVIHALELQTPDVRARVEQEAPRFLREHVLTWAGAEGSPVFQAFVEHDLTYLRLVLQKA